MMFKPIFGRLIIFCLSIVEIQTRFAPFVHPKPRFAGSLQPTLERGLSQSAARRQTQPPRNHSSQLSFGHPLRVGTSRAPLKTGHCRGTRPSRWPFSPLRLRAGAFFAMAQRLFRLEMPLFRLPKPFFHLEK